MERDWIGAPMDLLFDSHDTSLAFLDWHVVAHLPRRGGGVTVLALTPMFAFTNALRVLLVTFSKCRFLGCYDCASRTIIFLYSISLSLHCGLPPFTLRTMRLPSYLLHALPSPLLYHIRAHQYLLMSTLCAPFMPAFPRRYLMYHCTLGACLPSP